MESHGLDGTIILSSSYTTIQMFEDTPKISIGWIWHKREKTKKRRALNGIKKRINQL